MNNVANAESILKIGKPKLFGKNKSVKMKTNELTGVALDWAVAKCEQDGSVNSHGALWFLLWRDRYNQWMYSTNWAEGGPIIEREGIALQRWLECGWLADTWNFKFATGHSQGPTPLIAAMRCYVTSKFGDEIEIPKELK